MADIGMAAFSVFFMQSPSFLSHQRALEAARLRSNCETLFAMERIPTDNHIRKMLDQVAPDAVFGLFGRTLDLLKGRGGLKDFHRLDGRVLIAMDGTEYFTSQKLHCPNCSRRQRSNGKTEHYHSLVCAALLATMNLLAFAIHTVCDLVENIWRQARTSLGSRRRFFEDLRSITRYLVFADWGALIRTLITGEPPPEPP